MKRIGIACLMLSLVSGLGCGGSDVAAASGPADAAGAAFTGTLGNGALVSLSFGATPQALVASPAAVAASGTVTVTGTLKLPDTTVIQLTGSYNLATGNFTITGTGGWSLSGNYSNGILTGSFAGPGVTGSFVALTGSSAVVTQYCGTYSGGASGRWMMLKKGTQISGAYSSGTLSGSASGTSVNIAVHDVDGITSGTATGTMSGANIGGNWSVGGTTGTWTGITCT